MAARYLKAETSDLFTDAEVIFEKTEPEPEGTVVREDKALYRVKPAIKRLE